uniref:Uncharacterized protein n=1 Tax=Cucumis melo TaxID=3656 RepID=A0A9I9E8S4_CUCME
MDSNANVKLKQERSRTKWTASPARYLQIWSSGTFNRETKQRA